jgi:hypothetical protein
VANVSNPSAPVLVGSLPTSGYIFGVAVAGDCAYLSEFMDGSLLVVNVSVPSTPVLVGSVDLPQSTFGVAVAGHYAYVANGDAGFQIVDVSVPTAPVLVGHTDTPDWAVAVTVAGNYAYVADLGFGLQVVDVSQPSAPVIIGGLDLPGEGGGVAAAGHYVYLVDSQNGLEIAYQQCADDGTAVETEAELPARWALHSCVPNPFHSATTLRFDIPSDVEISLAIFDIAGRKVTDLVSKSVIRRGPHEATWQGTDAAGRPVTSGVYFCRLDGRGFTATREVILLK